MDIEINITGIESILRRFASVRHSLERKHQRAALRKTLKKAESLVRQNTPRGPTGNLRKSVGTMIEPLPGLRGTLQFEGRVGYRRKVGNAKGFHSHFLEKGTADREPQRGAVLAIPNALGRKYPYLRSVRRRGSPAIFLGKVRGNRPTLGFFQLMQNNSGMLVQDLKTNLAAAAEAAIRENSR
jgi:HK97 gp10 family phage protein